MRRNTQADIDAAVKELLSQRRDFMAAVLCGQTHVMASIQFIDNILSQMVPGYEPDFKSLPVQQR